MMSNYQDICRQFYDNRLLFGDPAEAGIVAVEIVPPGEVEIYRRSHGTLTRERRPLKLFALLAEPGMLNGLARHTRSRRSRAISVCDGLRPSIGSTPWKPRGAICASSPANLPVSPMLPT